MFIAAYQAILCEHYSGDCKDAFRLLPADLSGGGICGDLYLLGLISEHQYPAIMYRYVLGISSPTSIMHGLFGWRTLGTSESLRHRDNNLEVSLTFMKDAFLRPEAIQERAAAIMPSSLSWLFLVQPSHLLHGVPGVLRTARMDIIGRHQ